MIYGNKAEIIFDLLRYKMELCEDVIKVLAYRKRLYSLCILKWNYNVCKYTFLIKIY